MNGPTEWAMEQARVITNQTDKQQEIAVALDRARSGALREAAQNFTMRISDAFSPPAEAYKENDGTWTIRYKANLIHAVVCCVSDWLNRRAAEIESAGTEATPS